MISLAVLSNVARLQRAFTRLLQGPHPGLRQNGMDQTARLAWGRPAPNDPTLSAWLRNEALFEQYGNGIVTLTPRIWERLEPVDPQRGRLGGVMRWRHTTNALYKSEVDAVIERLTSQVDSLGIVGDWNGVTAGRLRLSQAHLGFTLVCVKPFDPSAIRLIMELAGWRLSPTGWVLPPHHPASRGHQLVIERDASVAPGGNPDNRSEASGPRTLEGPSAAMALVHRLMIESAPDRALQLLDRLIDTFGCPRRRQQLEAEARGSDEASKLRYVNTLFSRIFQSRSWPSNDT